MNGWKPTSWRFGSGSGEFQVSRREFSKVYLEDRPS